MPKMDTSAGMAGATGAVLLIINFASDRYRSNLETISVRSRRRPRLVAALRRAPRGFLTFLRGGWTIRHHFLLVVHSNITDNDRDSAIGRIGRIVFFQ